MNIRPHSSVWYDRLASMQDGYYYPWKSEIAPGNGEDAFWEAVNQQLSPEIDILDVGCGHGEVALLLAPNCKSILAYDRVQSYIQIAQNSAQKSGVENITYLWVDSSEDANDGTVRIPAGSDSFDLLISRRGPLHWIADARRVAKQGAIIIQLNPLETPIPSWAERLPEPLRSACGIDYKFGMRNSVEYQLEKAGLDIHSAWTYDVPEFFDDPMELYKRLSWGYLAGEVSSWEETRPLLERIFADYAWADGLVLRHTRLLWKAVVNKKPRR